MELTREAMPKAKTARENKYATNFFPRPTTAITYKIVFN